MLLFCFSSSFFFVFVFGGDSISSSCSFLMTILRMGLKKSGFNSAYCHFFFCLLCTLLTEIDYTSGDIDATMSIHSWSYAGRGEEGEFGLVKAGSVRSLPGLSYDGGRFGDNNMAAVRVLLLCLMSKL